MRFLTALLVACACVLQAAAFTQLSPATSSRAFCAALRPAACSSHRHQQRLNLAKGEPSVSDVEEPQQEVPRFADLAAAKEMTLEQRIEAMRREVAEQAAEVAAEEALMAPEDMIVDDETRDDTNESDYPLPEGFVDESKNIAWPGTRRLVQLSVLTVVSQVFFIFWVVAMNGFATQIPLAADAFTRVLGLGPN
jgi:hypothetical protein